MNAKLRIKSGNLELEFEGSEDFIKSEIPALLKLFSEIPKPDLELPGSTGDQQLPSGKVLDLSVSDIALRLNAESASELAYAAAAYLRFVAAKPKFKRIEILETMKAATGVYKDPMSGNLSKALIALKNQEKLMQDAGGDFALNAKSQAALLASLK